MNSYEQLGKAQYEGLAAMKPYHSPTLLESIDMKIASAKRQIESLEKVKKQLQEPGGILNVSIDDLRFAMQY